MMKVRGFLVSPDGHQFDEALLRQAREAARRVLDAVVVLDGPLPDGVFAIIRLRTGEELGSYAVLSREALDDQRLLEALGSSSRDYVEHPDADDEAIITLYRDHRYIRESSSLGRIERRSPNLSTVGGRFTMVQEFLNAADRGSVVDIPGLGPGRLVRPIR
jgi:hypothetical protein